MGNFLNKRLANTAAQSDSQAKEAVKGKDTPKPDLIQTLMEAAKKEEAKNL
jgi:hypothetical protein